MADEPVVTYSVSDLLRKMDDKIDRLLSMLAGKADQASVDRLEAKVTIHEGHIRGLLDERKDRVQADKNRIEWRKWAIPAGLSVLTIVVMILQIWHP